MHKVYSIEPANRGWAPKLVLARTKAHAKAIYLRHVGAVKQGSPKWTFRNRQAPKRPEGDPGKLSITHVGSTLN